MPSELSSATASPAGPPPAFDLGPGLKAVAFAPGRFATVVRRRLAGTHALQEVREDSAASLTLVLADGVARACRGWRYTMTNDGPDVHSDDRFREQAGYRGTYAVRDGVVELELARDDAVCAPIAEFMYPPPRATTISLRCVLAAPDGHPTLTAPVLVCRWTSTPARERDPHLIDGLGPSDALVLGAEPGLEVAIDAAPPGMETVDEPSTRITAAAAPLPDDAWQR